jgi:hypothetical protein
MYGGIARHLGIGIGIGIGHGNSPARYLAGAACPSP